jgi:nucleotide-binding universal stress UspA family protein
VRTIVCGVDRSPAARAGLRVAASVANDLGARLVAVHVLDSRAKVGPTAERVAASILYSEISIVGAVTRDEVGNVAERLAAVAHDENATMIILGSRSGGRSRTLLKADCAAELVELTPIPVLIAALQPPETREGAGPDPVETERVIQ